MGVGKDKTRNHIQGFQNEIDCAAQTNSDTFFNWFNESGGDAETSFLKGQCDFTTSILLPLVAFEQRLKDKTVLEIGYGGGRLLAPAARVFGKAIGIDVHPRQDIVRDELKRRGIENVELFQNDGRSLPVKNESVDVVYSFIVLQHVEKIDIFERYIEETYRALKTGGYAVLFYGRLHTVSLRNRSRILYSIDRLLDWLDPKKFKEIFAQVNCVNLRISPKYARMLCKRTGFTVLNEGVSKKWPDTTVYGGQQYLVLKK